MKHKVAELKAEHLDLITAEILNKTVVNSVYCLDDYGNIWEPSTNWNQGGPIIEREWLELSHWTNKSNENKRWNCIQYNLPTPVSCDGPTPLIAAMRCYVTSKLGREVEIPDELGEPK